MERSVTIDYLNSDSSNMYSKEYEGRKMEKDDAIKEVIDLDEIKIRDFEDFEFFEINKSDLI